MNDTSQPNDGPSPDAPDGPPLTELDRAISLMPDAAVIVGGDGSVLSVNAHAAELFGYAPGDLVGQPVEHLIPERSRHRHRQHRTSFVGDPQPRAMGTGLELYGRRRDGTEFPVDISLAPIGPEGTPYVVAAVRDATERQAAASAHSRLASIVNSSTDGIVAVSERGVVMSWNHGAESIFGYPAAEAEGRHISMIIPPESSPVFEELMDAAAAGRQVSPRDTRFATSDGVRVDVAISVSAIFERGDTDHPSGYSVLIRDVSERKSGERRLARQERLHAATAEIRLSLLSEAAAEDSLELLARWAVALSAASYAAAVAADGSGSGLVVVSAASGEQHTTHTANLPPAPLVAEALATNEPAVGRLGAVLPGLPRDWLSEDDLVAVVPAPPHRKQIGALVVWPVDDALTPDQQEVLSALAMQISLALELAAVRNDRNRLLLLGDRERIARDLHDLVIQRLFGAGLRLQGVLSMIDNPRAVERISSAVEDLDETIREIRGAIFGLEAVGEPGSDLKDEVIREVSAATERLGHEPSVAFHAPGDVSVPAHLRAEVLAVLREALSNAARHSKATAIEVTVSITDDLTLVVRDNGVGIGTPERTSGLANARERAEQLGGSMQVGSREGEGTRLEWSVPFAGQVD